MKRESKRPRYVVWRLHVYQGSFSYSELKEWMLSNFPPEYHNDIRAAIHGYTKNYSKYSLNWIASLSEYCIIKKELSVK